MAWGRHRCRHGGARARNLADDSPAAGAAARVSWRARAGTTSTWAGARRAHALD
jgi:hypothetical protein